MNTPQFTDLLLTLDDQGVATVTLNRAAKHNAFDDNVIKQLTHAFTFVAESSARVMVLAGDGKNFSAGADLNWMKRMANYSLQENTNDAKALANMLHTLNTLPMPTIARVTGSVFGGGVGLVACCDIAIATKLSKYCLSEVKLGLIPATISPYVIEAMGARACRRYFQTAEVFSARRARRLGLISESVTEEELDEHIEQIVAQCLKNGPNAMAQAKALIPQVQNRVIDEELLRFTSQQIAQTRVSAEGQLGLSAFLNKEPANWEQANED